MYPWPSNSHKYKSIDNHTRYISVFFTVLLNSEILLSYNIQTNWKQETTEIENNIKHCAKEEEEEEEIQFLPSS